MLSPLRVWLPLCVGTALARQSGNALTTRKDCDAPCAKAFTMSRTAAPAVQRAWSQGPTGSRNGWPVAVLALPLRGAGAGIPGVCADYECAPPAPGCRPLGPGGPTEQDGRYVASKVEAAARPVRQPAACRRLAPACGRCPGGAVTAFPDQALPAKEPTNGSGQLGDDAMSGNLGSLEPNVAAGMERNL